MKRKTKITITLLIVIIFFSISALCTQFGRAPVRPGVDEPETQGDRQEAESQLSGGPTGDIDTDNGYHILYLEIGTDQDSNHFEHRVANIFTVAPDGSDKKLIYSDIDAEYELGRIYSISPDGSKVSSGFFEGGRGAYSSLSIIDLKTGSMASLVEFDYTQSEPYELLSAIYENPVWTNDSSGIAYEIISYPFTDNFSDGGIFLVDVLTKEAVEIILDIEEESLKDTMFLYPVLFTAGDKKLFNIFHSYGPEDEDGPVLDFVTRNKKLVIVDTGGGKVKTVINVSKLEGGKATLGHFSAVNSQDKLVFDIQYISGKNGDIWSSGFDGTNISRLTDTHDTMEIQPSVLEIPGSMPRVAYTAVQKSPDMQEKFIGGDIYIIDLDGNGKLKITDYGTGAAAPIFSPDGRYIAYIHYIFDENMDYIESTQIEVFDMESGETLVAASGSGIFSLAGWVENE